VEPVAFDIAQGQSGHDADAAAILPDYTSVEGVDAMGKLLRLIRTTRNENVHLYNSLSLNPGFLRMVAIDGRRWQLNVFAL